MEQCNSRLLECGSKIFLAIVASQSTLFSYLLARRLNWQLWCNKPCVHSCRRPQGGGSAQRLGDLLNIMGHLPPEQFWIWILSCSDGDSLKRKALLSICIALKLAPWRYCDLQLLVTGQARHVRSKGW